MPQLPPIPNSWRAVCPSRKWFTFFSPLNFILFILPKKVHTTHVRILWDNAWTNINNLLSRQFLQYWDYMMTLTFLGNKSVFWGALFNTEAFWSCSYQKWLSWENNNGGWRGTCSFTGWICLPPEEQRFPPFTYKRATSLDHSEIFDPFLGKRNENERWHFFSVSFWVNGLV